MTPKTPDELREQIERENEPVKPGYERTAEGKEVPTPERGSFSSLEKASKGQRARIRARRYGTPCVGSPDQSEGIEVPVVWMGPEDIPILFANAFVSQFDQTLDSFIVTIGQLNPPPLQGATPDELREQAEQITFVPVKPIARLSLSPRRMDEFLATLQANVDQLERASKMRRSDPR